MCKARRNADGRNEHAANNQNLQRDTVPLNRKTGIFGHSRRAVSLRYTAGIVFDAFKLTVFVLAGAEAIFLSDAIVASILPKILEHQAGLANLFLLIVLTIPKVLIVALPLALLVGVYLTMLRRREASEFAVVAGMGYSARALIALAFLIGLAGLIASVLLSGYVEPLARSQLVKTVHRIKYDALREGKIAAGKFYEIGNYVVFASSGRISDVANNIFVHQSLEQTDSRIIIADQTIRFETPQSRNIGLILKDVAIHDFERFRPDEVSDERGACQDCDRRMTASPFSVMRSDQFFVNFPTDELPAHEPPGSRPEEWTSFELLMSGAREEWMSRVLGERLLRGLLCFIAPLLGLLALAMTTQRTYLFVLPGIGAVLLGAGFFGSFAVKLLVPIGLSGMTAVLVALTAGSVLLTMILIRRAEHGYLRSLGVWM